VPECLLIEPTDSETREELDGFVEALAAHRRAAKSVAAPVEAAPHTLPGPRLDDVRAARQLDVAWKPAAPE
jgi:glycine dehydrogenase subunit 2